MCISVKTKFLAFWILCKICMTFAIDPLKNNRFAGYYAQDHHPLYNPLPGFNDLNLGEPNNVNANRIEQDPLFNPLLANNRLNLGEPNNEIEIEIENEPLINPLLEFNRLNLGEPINENENEIDNAASENNSEDETESDLEDEAESDSEEEGEILSEEVKKCKEAIKTYFKNSRPADSLDTGYLKLTEGKFDITNENYKYSHGYYVDLLENSISNVESSNIWSVKEFCQRKFKYQKFECLVNIEDAGINRDSSGLEAYEIMYFTMDYEMLDLDYLFPDRAYEFMTYGYGPFGTKLEMIQRYYLYLNNQYKYLNLENLNTRHGYCQKVCEG